MYTVSLENSALILGTVSSGVFNGALSLLQLHSIAATNLDCSINADVEFLAFQDTQHSNLPSANKKLASKNQQVITGKLMEGWSTLILFFFFLNLFNLLLVGVIKPSATWKSDVLLSLSGISASHYHQ